MNEFTWINMYKEIAAELKNYKDRQQELIKILADLQKRGLSTILLTDKNAKGEQFPLAEIDPFTFFANFNRGIKKESRIEIIKILKKLWGLTSDIPTDFTGTPVVNNKSTWFFAYKKERGKHDIQLLWELFTQALDNNINPQTFNAVLKQRNIKFNITMGLFWINPDRYLNLDSVNRKYLAKHVITVSEPPDYQTYIEYLQKIKSALEKPFYEISHDAWLDEKNTAETTKKKTTPSAKTQQYWVYAPGEQARFWDQYLKEGLMGVGWKELKEDLSKYQTEEALRKKFFEVYKDGSEMSFNQLRSFLHKVKKGDLVFVKHGTKELVGFGEVTSDYFYDPNRPEYRHLRKAQWQKQGSWFITEDMKTLPVKTLTALDDQERIKQLLSLIEEKPDLPTLEGTKQDQPVGPIVVPPPYSIEDCSEATGFTKERIKYWLSAIDRKKQAIFYGPPGTGKTFIADHLARHIVGGTDGFMDCIQFHPAYAYEEFIQGIRPETDERGNLQFALKSGRFLDFCSRARQRKKEPCVLIIDEINRANLACVFGELMYLLEYRDKDMPLAGGLRFSIPENVRIIGTMNTADRSIALVDFALRRRFAFLELSPEYDVLLAYQRKRDFNAEGLVRVLRDINSTINDKNFHLGISFFMTDNLSEKLEEIWKMEV